MPNTSMSFRRPWILSSIDCPKINPVWLAEYMAQHDLSMEVAMEHMAYKLREFLLEAKHTVEQIEGSDEELMRECAAFVSEYKPMKDFYSPIPLIEMVKEK